jgi:ferric-dicitrate binding protein FerR (iron transport regulator)
MDHDTGSDIARYLVEYFSSGPGPGDPVALERWARASAGNRREFQGCFKVFQELRRAGFIEGWDGAEAWSRLVRALARRRAARRRAWRVAVSGVAAIAGVAFLALSRAGGGAGAAPPVAGDIVAGGPRAELTLAGGERVVIGPGRDRVSLVAGDVTLWDDTLSRRLHYRVAGGGDGDGGDEGRYHLLHVPRGGEYSLSLPDGTVARLNSSSTLRFPARFGAVRREVYLDGEAYLDVSEEAGRPFVLHAGGCEITVLGTSFNASAYGTEDVARVTLVAGSVRLDHGGRRYTLSPGDHCVARASTGEVTIERVDPRLHASWIDGKFHFSGCSLEELARQLERWYDFTMVYASPGTREMRFSGTVNKHGPLSETLRFLELTGFIRFTIAGDTVTAYKINGR